MPTYFSATKMKDLAKEAVDRAMVDSDLDTEIAKVAGREDLNPEQIQRVVEAANHDAYARTYKTAEDKRFTIPLATKTGVLAKLNNATDEKLAKTASADDDFFSLRKFDKGLSKVASAIPTSHNRFLSMGGTEALKQSVIQQLHQTQSKMAQYRREIQAVQTESYFEAEAAGVKLAAEVQRLMSEEGRTFAEIYSAARHGMPKEAHPIVALVFDKMAAKLSRPGKVANAPDAKMLKKFDSKDFEELGGRQVDGNQPLFIHLKPCVRSLFTYSCCGPIRDCCDKSTSGIVTAIHNLKTDKDVEEYIANEVQPFANNVRKGIKFAMQYMIDHAEDETWIAKTAGFKDVLKTIMPSLSVAQILNQLIHSGGAAKNSVSQFLSDLSAPGHVRSGISMTGLMDQARAQR